MYAYLLVSCSCMGKLPQIGVELSNEVVATIRVPVIAPYLQEQVTPNINTLQCTSILANMHCPMHSTSPQLPTHPYS